MATLKATFSVGALTVHALSDGASQRPPGNFFAGVDPADWTAALGLGSAEGTIPFNFGSFLVTGDGHTTLIDSGYGTRARTMPGLEGGGELLARIAEVGVRREDVDRVVHTHLHGDHIGWNIDGDAGGAITFPNATVFVHARELEYWTGPKTAGTDRGDVARAHIEPLVAVGRVQTFEGEAALSDVLTAVPTPGHTPGHCAMLLASGGAHLLVLGDAAHHPVHLEHHDWIPEVDLDREESKRSRAKIAALAADRDALVTGGHFPILTLGRVRRAEGGYRWEPV